MTNEIISTLSSIIGSIQLNLFDFDLEKPDFKTKITRNFQSSNSRQNVNQQLKLLENNHFEYLNAICPICHSKHMIKQEYQQRNPVLGNRGFLQIMQIRTRIKKNTQYILLIQLKKQPY